MRTLAWKPAVALATVALLTAACSSNSPTSSDSGRADGPTGDPVPGGTVRVAQASEPRSLDPAALANTYAQAAIVGNSLYGTLLIDDAETGEFEFRILKDLSSTDGGKSFQLVVRDGIQFSDGSPVTAEDVKATWDHIRDPKAGSFDYPQASVIKAIDVVDEMTAKVTLSSPMPMFPQTVVESAMNWVTSAEALQGGAAVMDSAPVGAGPFVLKEWSRQDVMVLVRNENYYDAPRPHVDQLEFRAVGDDDQRLNSLTSGGLDVVAEGKWDNVAKAKDAGLQVNSLDLNGGAAFILNSRRAPFDDLRARQAFAKAFDWDTFNSAVFGGAAEHPDTLFQESSPFYRDTALVENDPDGAQALFDQLADEGKPVSFTITTFAGSESQGEAVQTMLAGYDNVDVKVKAIDISEYGALLAERDFDTLTSTMIFGRDPEPRLWFVLHSQSMANLDGIVDPALDEALGTGQTSEDQAERDAAYEVVQERVAEIVPGVMYSRASASVLAQPNVGGLHQYGLGSLLPEELWLQP